MENGKRLNLSWDNIDLSKDHMITYLLYREGKNIESISRIRNMTEEEVKQQLILAKTEVFSKNRNQKSMLEKMLEITKSERYTILSSITLKEKKI